MKKGSPEESKAFNKDALLHQLQDKIDSIVKLVELHWEGITTTDEFIAAVVDIVIEEEGENGSI